MTEEEMRKEIEQLQSKVKKTNLFAHILQRMLLSSMELSSIEANIHDNDRSVTDAEMHQFHEKLEWQKHNLLAPKRELDNFPDNIINKEMIDELYVYFSWLEKRIMILQLKLKQSIEEVESLDLS